MKTRLPANKNLTIHDRADYYGLPIITHRGPLIAEYLAQIQQTLYNALAEHHRTMAVRVDLHIPLWATNLGTDVISKFIASLISQINNDILRKRRSGKRVHNCSVRFIWAKERDTACNAHYHLVLLFNRDTYYCLGKYGSKNINLANRIIKAWNRALGMDNDFEHTLVHFPANPIYHVENSLLSLYNGFFDLFYRASYLAKVETKNYGDGHVFGCSRR